MPDRRWRIQQQSVCGSHGGRSEAAGDLAGDDNAGFWHYRAPGEDPLRWNFGCTFECDGKPYTADYAATAFCRGARKYEIICTTSGVRRLARRWPLSAVVTVIVISMKMRADASPFLADPDDIFRKTKPSRQQPRGACLTSPQNGFPVVWGIAAYFDLCVFFCRCAAW